MTDIIKYLNYSLANKRSIFTFKYFLTKYIHSSYTYYKRNPDGSYLKIQPGFKDKKWVTKYYTYDDPSMARNHKTTRLVLIFDDNTTYEISLYKFKRYLRRIINYEKQ